jgi:hypothetical protein
MAEDPLPIDAIGEWPPRLAADAAIDAAMVTRYHGSNVPSSATCVGSADARKPEPVPDSEDGSMPTRATRQGPVK